MSATNKPVIEYEWHLESSIVKGGSGLLMLKENDSIVRRTSRILEVNLEKKEFETLNTIYRKKGKWQTNPRRGKMTLVI